MHVSTGAENGCRLCLYIVTGNVPAACRSLQKREKKLTEKKNVAVHGQDEACTCMGLGTTGDS